MLVSESRVYQDRFNQILKKIDANKGRVGQLKELIEKASSSEGSPELHELLDADGTPPHGSKDSRTSPSYSSKQYLLRQKKEFESALEEQLEHLKNDMTMLNTKIQDIQDSLIKTNFDRSDKEYKYNPEVLTRL